MSTGFPANADMEILDASIAFPSSVCSDESAEEAVVKVAKNNGDATMSAGMCERNIRAEVSVALRAQVVCIATRLSVGRNPTTSRVCRFFVATGRKRERGDRM